MSNATTKINTAELVILDELNEVETAAREAMQTWFNKHGINPEIELYHAESHIKALTGVEAVADLLKRENMTLWDLWIGFFDHAADKRNREYKKNAIWIEDGDIKIMVFAQISLYSYKLYFCWCFVDDGMEGEDSRDFDTYEAAYADAESGMAYAKQL